MNYGFTNYIIFIKDIERATIHVKSTDTAFYLHARVYINIARKFLA